VEIAITAANAVASHHDLRDLEDPENWIPIGAPSRCGPALHETGHEFDRSPYRSSAMPPQLLDDRLDQPDSRSHNPVAPESSSPRQEKESFILRISPGISPAIEPRR
jgi:hypothetical protein